MKTKRIITTTALIILSLTHRAQDKYEYMTISYEAVYKQLIVCIDGKQPVAEAIKLEKAENVFLNNTPLLKKVNEYQGQDWEVVTFNTTGFSYANTSTQLVFVAYLRKKINEKK